jgi:hypothetical protein
MKQPSRKAYFRKYQKRYYVDNQESIRRKHREHWVNNPEKRILKQAQTRAKTTRREFTITIDDIVIPKICPVLGIEIDEALTDSRPSIDRVDSDKGYTPDNIAIISWRANCIKNNGTAEEHERIATWMRSKGVK